MSVDEAAQFLGLSPSTIRRRIREGSIAAERVERPQGYTLVVTLPETSSGAAVAAAAAAHQPPRRLHLAPAPVTAATDEAPALLEALRLIERQQSTIMELSGRIGYYQAQNEQLHDALKALQAPSDEPPRAPWWRRFFDSVLP